MCDKQHHYAAQQHEASSCFAVKSAVNSLHGCVMLHLFFVVLQRAADSTGVTGLNLQQSTQSSEQDFAAEMRAKAQAKRKAPPPDAAPVSA